MRISLYPLGGILSLFLVLSVGCGVKGKPQPPLIPAFIGRGEPSFAKPLDKSKATNQGKKKIEGDFEDPDDFAAPPEEAP